MVRRGTKEAPLEKPGIDGAIRKKKTSRNLSTLQQRMQKKLNSGQFRMLNESMYTNTGAQSSTMMSKNPELFSVYHTGYAEQVKRWPRNPLDDIISYLSSQSPGLCIADLGCGEARLSRHVPQENIKSFDLVAANSNVIECDIAHVPLPDSSVDVAVFCLSLMGTNYGDFLREAHRIVVPNGQVLVAEVASRFEGHDTKSFVAGVESLGFKLDEDHPLVRSGQEQNNGARSSRQVRKKRNKRKKKAVRSEVEKEAGAAAFFFKFAFRSTKGETVKRAHNKRPRELPKLAACVYKKR